MCGSTQVKLPILFRRPWTTILEPTREVCSRIFSNVTNSCLFQNSIFSFHVGEMTHSPYTTRISDLLANFRAPIISENPNIILENGWICTLWAFTGEHDGGLHYASRVPWPCNLLEPINHRWGGQEWTPRKLRLSLNFIMAIAVQTKAVLVETRDCQWPVCWVHMPRKSVKSQLWVSTHALCAIPALWVTKLQMKFLTLHYISTI